MKYRGLEVGQMPKEIFEGKVTVVTLRYILGLLNEIYRDFLNTTFSIVLEHTTGMGYSIDCMCPQRWMGGQTRWNSSDKVGVYLWVKRCIQECRQDLNFIIEQNKGIVNVDELILYRNKLDVVDMVLDKPKLG